ncbi:MAG: hypothetical protein H7126_13880 [Candidatus Parcubacteria bacterium]|nr:hypothetical protein [Leptolyngbyaceae cyanobacterium LF-bin-113]
METRIEIGGKVEGDRAPTAIALSFEIASIAALRAQAICVRAHDLLITKTSTDRDFLTDVQIEQKIKLIDREYREGKEALAKLLDIHKFHRSIHWDRIQVAQRAQKLKEAEDKYL